jgi:hypothetical protein
MHSNLIVSEVSGFDAGITGVVTPLLPVREVSLALLSGGFGIKFGTTGGLTGIG